MKKLKITGNKIFVYFYSLIILFTIAIFALVTLFLYNNFYKTIIQSEEVLVLRSEVAIEDINMNKFNQILDRLKEKVKERDINISINF